MSLAKGQSLSFYEILGPLGVGAMGEVYRAKDTRLDREVAIKVLPEHFAADAERLLRFEREAKSLAALNHPNVAQIFGVDRVEDTCFLVLELVPGETLEDRIARAALPLDETVDICRQIAEGLEAAHDAGVIHRDLKPANVRITPDGKVKVLDFGLAKPTGPDADTRSTTDSALATEEGRVIGTPIYMAPEQARGKPIDRRVDVWAFGCVLFECLTGKRAFHGETMPDVLAAVVHEEANYDRLPPATPAHVRELLERCLHKDPRARLRDIGEARVRLGEPHGLFHQTGPQPRAAPRSRQPWLPWAIAVAAIGLAGARFFWTGSGEAAPNPQVRFTIRHPSETPAIVTSPVVAPDGSYVAYIAVEGNVARLWVREFAASEPRALPGTEGAHHVFVSPDSRFLGFYAANKMKKVAVSGGTPVDIGSNTKNPGATWGADGTIRYSRSWTSGLERIQAEGGAVEELTMLDTEAGEIGHYWPTPLPEGDELLYTVYTTAGTLNEARIELFDPATGHARFVADGAQPIPLASGHLLYSRAGVYELAPFDARSGTLTGPPRTVLAELPPLVPEGSQRHFVSISKNGVMAYVARNNDPVTAPRSWFWLDASGALEALSLPASTLRDPALSPDGSLAIVRTVAGDPDIFVHDLEAGSETRITTGSINLDPEWSPDGKRLLFESTLRNGSFDVFEANPMGGGAAEPLYTREVDVFLGGLTLDGKGLVAALSRLETGDDIVLVDLESGEFEPLVATPGNEEDPTLSPDGRLVAYRSNVSGQDHVYVVPLSGESAPVKVSRKGGMDLAWTAGGSKLAFSDARQVFLADISFQGGQVTAGRPAPFLKDGFPEDLARRFTGDFAITAEGDRIIIGLLDEPARAEIEVVLDGFAALGIR